MDESSWRSHHGGGIHLRLSPLAFNFGWFGDSILGPLGSAVCKASSTNVSYDNYLGLFAMMRTNT